MRAVIFVSILAASACVANAEEASGDPEAAPVHTHEVCSRCHAVTAEQARQRMIAIAPDFQTTANTPGITAPALRAFLQTPHPKMPNLILTPENQPMRSPSCSACGTADNRIQSLEYHLISVINAIDRVEMP